MIASATPPGAGDNVSPSSSSSSSTLKDAAPSSGPKLRPKAGGSVNLFDPAATASRFLTRRFGIVSGGVGGGRRSTWGVRQCEPV